VPPVELRTRLLFTLAAQVDPPQVEAATPAGGRRVLVVRGGTFDGPRLRGRILPDGGHDWALTRADGSLLLDVRLVLETSDGAQILMTYWGIRHGPAEVLAALATGQPVDPQAYYFRMAARFETGAAGYDWLNRVVSVGVGERPPAGPRYTVYEVL
jgi:hypothetical protein